MLRGQRYKIILNITLNQYERCTLFTYFLILLTAFPKFVPFYYVLFTHLSYLNTQCFFYYLDDLWDGIRIKITRQTLALIRSRIACTR